MKKVVGKLAVFVILFFLTISLHAQTPRELYGSFEAGCQVFNYHYKQEANQVKSFAIYELGNLGKRIELKPEKLSVTITNLEALDTIEEKPESLTDDEWEGVAHLKLLREILQEVQNTDDSTQNIGKYKDKINVFAENEELNWDTILSKSLGANMDTTGYTLGYLVRQIAKIVDIDAGNELPVYLSFNDFKIEVFKGVFAKLIKDKIPSFDAACKYQEDDLVNRVFYEIKSRIDFLDDEPVTAYLKLRTNKLKVYMQNDDGIGNKTLKKMDATRRRMETNIRNLYEAKKSINKNDPLYLKKDSLYNSHIDIQSKKLDTVKGRIIQYELKNGYAVSTFSNRNDRHLEMEVDNVTVEFEDGAIKNLFVDLSYVKNKVKIPIRFRNNMPISVSSKFDPDAFESHTIFAGTPCVLYRAVQGRGATAMEQVQKQSDVNINNNCLDLYFVLSDLMDYLIVAQPEKEDFSPANEVYTLNPQNPTQQLKKELRSKILNVRFYSDLVGIKDDQPNGLIQIEASKRINLKTIRTQKGKEAYTGWLTYIEPKITIRKIEQNNKSLFLKRQDSVVLEDNVRYRTDPLSILQYANFSLTTDLNIHRLNIPRYKANWHTNVLLGFYRTAVSDTVTADTSNIEDRSENINSGMAGIQIIYELKPDSRFGASFGLEFRYLHPFNQKYFVDGPMKRFIHTIWFEGFMKTNESDGRLFFRTRFNQLVGEWNRNFMQIQFGYAVNLFKRK